MSWKKKLGILVVLIVAGWAAFQAMRPSSTRETALLAADAYIYGYPLVTFDMVRQQETNVEVPDDQRAPMGQMIKMRSYPPVESHAAAAPNADTLYTMVWLDVSEEPSVISVPDIGDRYYILPFTDGFSEIFHVASSLTTGSKPQTYAVTGPGWKGTLPTGVTELKSPTGMVWVLGRIYCTGTPEDYIAVHTLQDQFSVVPLSGYGKTYTPPKGVVNAEIDMKTSVRDQVNALDIETYFNYLAELLVTNPPHPEDAGMVEKMAQIGIVAGQKFDLSKVNKADRTALEAVPKLSLAEMGLHLKKQPTTNGWLYFTSGVGNFGTDYLTRGMANLLGPGWNHPQDAIYPIAMEDADGDKLDGSKHSYVMRFEKGQLPPVDAFWSLTMYDKDLFFVPNTISRFTLSQRDTFITNADGSIDIHIQAESPGKEKEANWLPAPKGIFKLVLRLYGPAKEAPTIVDGSWTPPGAVKIK